MRKLARLFPYVIMLGVVIAFTGPSLGQSLKCMPRAEVVEWLKREYREKPVAQGMNPNGVVEVFASPDGNTWTLTITDVHGVTCALGSGDGWDVFPVKRPGRES